MITTKKARKGLSIAAAVSLAAGLLTGFVAPANATETLAATPAVGLRATQSYSNSVVLAHLKLSTLNNDGFISGTATGGGYCLRNGHVMNGSNWDTQAECEGAATPGVWVSTSVTTGAGIWLNSEPTDGGLVASDFALTNVVESVDSQTVTADLVFAAGSDSFGAAGNYNLKVTTALGYSNATFNIVVGGDVKTAVFTPEYNPAPAGVAMDWTLGLKDASGNVTSLKTGETVDITVVKSGDLVPTAVLTSVAFTQDVDATSGAFTGGYTVSETNLSAGTWLYHATVQAATDVDSNTVTLVVKDVTTAGSLAVIEKAGVAKVDPSHAAIRTDVRTAQFKWTATAGADDAGKFIAVDAYAVGGIVKDLTVVPTVAYVQLDAAGTYTVSVTDNDTTIDADTDSYIVEAAGDAIEATYRAAGYGPIVDLVSSTGYVDDSNDNYKYYYKSIVAGSSVTMNVKVTDIFGAPLKNKALTMAQYGWGDDAAWLAFDNNEVTDSNGNATFSVTSDETAASLTNGEDANGFEITLDGISEGNQDELYVEAYVVKSVTPAALYATADGAAKAAFNSPVRSKSIDTLDATDADNVDLAWEVVNSDNLDLYGVPVTVSTTAGGYVSAGHESAIADMTAGSKVFPSDGSQSADATSTKTGSVTFTVSAGSLSDSFTLNYTNAVSDARYITAAEATASVTPGQYKTVTYTVTDRFGNAVADVDVDVTETGVGRLANGTSLAELHTDAAGVVSVDVVAGADEAGAQTVTATVHSGGTQVEAAVDTPVKGVAAGIKVATTKVTYVAPVLKVKVAGHVKSITVQVWNAKGQYVRVYVGGKLRSQFWATSSYVARNISSTKGTKTVVVRIAKADFLLKRLVKVLG